jgi:Ras-related protein Rab-18
MEADV